MNNKYKYLSKLCLISIITFMCFVSSCTYDYFEDETNYVVYVPKADENKVTNGQYQINDVRILIYGDVGFEKHTHVDIPFFDNPRYKVGNFYYRIYPGQHNVFCFSNTTGIDFRDLDIFTDAYFELTQTDNNIYTSPPRALLDTKMPIITYPGPLVIDTAHFERKYVGQICVAVKNMQKINSSLTSANISSVRIIATNVGVKQSLSSITDSINTRSTRNNINDKIILTSNISKDLPIEFSSYEFGFANYYFPSLDPISEGVTNEIPIELNVSFLDASGNVIGSSIDVALYDDNFNPRVLHMNETIWIGLDGNNIHVFTINSPLEWNPIILGGGPGVEM